MVTAKTLKLGVVGNRHRVAVSRRGIALKDQNIRLQSVELLKNTVVVAIEVDAQNAKGSEKPILLDQLLDVLDRNEGRL